MSLIYPDDPIEDVTCSVCGLAVDVGTGGCSCDREPVDEPFDWPLCPLCACPINECHRDGCCALKKRSEEA